MSGHPKSSKSGSRVNGSRMHKRPSGKLPVMASIQTMDAGEKISAIRNGVSKNELEEIKEQSGLDYDTLSGILAVSRATLINKKGTEKFDAPTSERILLLADTLAYGQSVFEDRHRFNVWMKNNNKSLGDKAPIEYMDTLYGIQEVRKLIGRIEYGVF
jgi:putative toxin-antitoxin system antitoxin component (TIGR02293 family)